MGFCQQNQTQQTKTNQNKLKKPPDAHSVCTMNLKITQVLVRKLQEQGWSLKILRKVSYFSPYSPGFSSFKEHRSRADSEGELAGSEKRPGTGAGLLPTSLTPGLSPPHLSPGIRVDPTEPTLGLLRAALRSKLTDPGVKAAREPGTHVLKLRRRAAPAGRARAESMAGAGGARTGGRKSCQQTSDSNDLHTAQDLPALLRLVSRERRCFRRPHIPALAVSRPHPGFRGGPLKGATRSAALSWVITRVVLRAAHVRSKREYDESHVITALLVKKRAGKYLIPESVDLECVEYCVVYDNSTISLELMLKDESSDDDNADDGKHRIVLGAAVECGRTLTHLTRHPVLILRGGYEHFSAMYHFFRTQKIIWMPQELDAFQPYPIEIMPGRIYLGNFKQACDPKIQKDLKINAHVNISMETGPFFVGDADRLLHIQIEDSLEASITPFLRLLCHFIGPDRPVPREQRGPWRLRSWAYLKKCKNNMRPNRALVAQLSEWEKVVLGDIVTDIQNPPY
ncbi:STYXL1 [Cervus elaphus hippelaphus]|uniref:STYXL1 n=1 Tax=Cervus elaphus hippelaphus TaxID=46360 RepID=A0A212CZ81_CEREH|nr:STYXL1 [Cervus elaphus hippelaphus]